ncbi:MAG: PorP/SprF family type IX secretion system membrane protein [Saprospiraceae bacterium]|nr:PorP/SprF family type IX secretion system membrane protein [Saprospiraceae bacterium]
MFFTIYQIFRSIGPAGTKTGVVIVALLVSTCILAQQTPQYTMTMLDKYRFNPAYAGMEASLVITGSLKSQWETFPGQPKFQQVNAHLPLYIANGGAGFKFYHDAVGAEQTMGFQASYNYVIDSDIGIFSVGLSAGMIQKKINGALLRTPDGIYEGNTIVHNDPILSSTKGSGIGPTASLGVFFANDYIEAGIAIDQAFGNTIKANNAEETTFQLKRGVNAFVEYSYAVTDEIVLYPAIFAKTDLVQTQLDVMVRAEYQDLYFGGLVFRGYNANTVDAVAIFLGTRISSSLKVGYAYDITLSGLRNFTDGTHELFVQYDLNKPVGIGRPEKIIYNPRY